MKASLALESTDRRFEIYRPKTKAALSAVFSFLRTPPFFLEVYFLKNEEIRRINRRFRGKNKPTNVLSFEADRFGPRPDVGAPFLGEIFIAPDYALRKKEPLAGLLVHGLLHLLGYTHVNVRDRIKMEVLEKRIETYLIKRKVYF